MNVKVLSDLKLAPDPNGKTWQLLDDFTVEIDDIAICVPAGYRTDLTSSARIVMPFVPRWGKYGFGAVVHDYLYDGRGFSRLKSDLIFNAIMKHYKTKNLQRWTIMFGVFLLGWLWFGRINKYGAISASSSVNSGNGQL